MHVEYWDNLDIPFDNYALQQQLFVRKVGIGSDVNSLMQHYQHLANLAKTKNYDKLEVEATNMFLNYQAILNPTNIDAEILATYVKKINDNKVSIKTMSDIEEIADKLKNIGQGRIIQTYIDLKKKLMNSWIYSFLTSTLRKIKKLKFTTT